MSNLKVDRDLLKDEKGRYRTQSLFIEFTTKPEQAIFTLQGEDKLDVSGIRAVRPLISLKRRYLEMNDIFEYEFANTWLYDWDHWQKFLNNKVLFRHIEKWRDELELKIKSEGLGMLFEKAEFGDYQAIKYLADNGWNKKVGRPSKLDKQKEQAQKDRIEEEFGADILRLKGR